LCGDTQDHVWNKVEGALAKLCGPNWYGGSDKFLAKIHYPQQMTTWTHNFTQHLYKLFDKQTKAFM
jgi:hypothetical protein